MGDDDRHGGRLAPVTYLPGAAPADTSPRSAGQPARAASLPPRRSTVAFTETWADESDPEEESDRVNESAVLDVRRRDDELDEAVEDREAIVAMASTSLTRSLGRRGLSVAEARAKLRTGGLTAEESVVVVDAFLERGWLDDAALAEQLVHSATTRQGMGTKAVRQLLQKRMLARDVIDAVIAELPDDDVERALEFAASKARSLLRLDDETATRRLMGQLARRGFGGAVAGNAARTALADARREAGGAVGGVRFR